MNKEEISFRLLELYYTKIYKAYDMSLDTFLKKYKYVLDKLKELKEEK